ncbi:hypothetical protein H2201_003011 [Coniosporium apollinis]|uniref:Glutathione S-transferase n=2 Tax=Coniosporium TaxID=2810619 RepID=A0ABQ9P3C5_9PEZI|nr:hypothetical protein H2199_007753 [Cladosporium sp. JES 115]KAJ9666877.1 hypothetical protein H2201_003011 [Coniosporium apollinis]
MSKPITLYSHKGGPNPWKVAIILEELGLPYETTFIEFQDMKKEGRFIDINPNGRVPAIEDPNTGVAMFESGAIIEYLVETYDKPNNLTYTSSPEKYLLKSWLHFQMSGQGPYFGQKAWFELYHPEKNLKSAIDRYANEIRRVLGVVDAHLKKQGTEYLVGDKCTYADLAWVPWDMALQFLLGEGAKKLEEELPTYKAWHDRLMARPAVQKIVEDRTKANSQ